MIVKSDFVFGGIQARAAMLTPRLMVRAEKERSRKPHLDEDVTRLVDGTLEDSFPASDPPSWTASVARPAPPRKVLVRASDFNPPSAAASRCVVLTEGHNRKKKEGG